MDLPNMPPENGRLKRPNALYSINNEKTAAGLDALFCAGPDALAELTEYLSLNRVILGNGGFCILMAKLQCGPNRSVLDANGIFAEYLEDELVEKAIYYMVPLRGLVICLVAMPQYRKSETARLTHMERLIHESCERASEHFKTAAHMDVMVAISPIFFGTEGIRGTFHRTMDHLQYHFFWGKTHGVFLPPKDLPERNIRLSVELSDSCRKAVNLLFAQQYDAFDAELIREIETLRNAVPRSLQQFKVLCVQYLDQLCCKIVDNNMASMASLVQVDLFWLVEESLTYEELIQAVKNMLEQLTEGFRKQKRQSKLQLADQMKAYLQQHHTDANLTISAVAERFQMTQPVFSAYFKKFMGIAPLEYLNKLRVQHAWERLKMTSDTLPSVAEAAGFGSVSTMHRVFKNETGTTPARVRELLESPDFYVPTPEQL